MAFTTRKVSDTRTVRCLDESCPGPVTDPGADPGTRAVRDSDGRAFATKAGLSHTIETGHPTEETRVTVTRSEMIRGEDSDG